MLRIAAKKIQNKWSRHELLKGFLIAFIFHGALFFIFHIEKIFDPNRLPLLVPVSVEVDLSSYFSQKSIQNGTAVFPIENDSLPNSLDFPSFEWSFEKKFHSRIRHILDFPDIEKMEYESTLSKEEEDDFDWS